MFQPPQSSSLSIVHDRQVYSSHLDLPGDDGWQLSDLGPIRQVLGNIFLGHKVWEMMMQGLTANWTLHHVVQTKNNIPVMYYCLRKHKNILQLNLICECLLGIPNIRLSWFSYDHCFFWLNKYFWICEGYSMAFGGWMASKSKFNYNLFISMRWPSWIASRSKFQYI